MCKVGVERTGGYVVMNLVKETPTTFPPGTLPPVVALVTWRDCAWVSDYILAGIAGMEISYI
jgi:hypothetical protein